VLWFLGAHSVDILRWLVGDDIVRVQAFSRSVVLIKHGLPVPDLYQSVLEFRDGVIAQMENHWIMPNSSPNVNDIKISIVGSKGSINLDLTHNQTIERALPGGFDHPDTRVNVNMHGRSQGLAIASIEHFVDALDTDREFLVGLDDGLAATAALEALLVSAARGVPVPVPGTQSVMDDVVPPASR